MDNTGILSPREKEVADLLMQGKSNKQIAYALGISERTVEFHLKNIFEKMNVNSRVEFILKPGKTTGEKSGSPAETTVDLGEQRINNDRQTDTQSPPDQDMGGTVSADKKESVMYQKLATILPPFVILVGLALIVGGMISQKYGAVIIGICAAGMAAFHWVQVLKKKNQP